MDHVINLTLIWQRAQVYHSSDILLTSLMIRHFSKQMKTSDFAAMP
uniref:Uncharacterized protein n=1 Tax=Heterorhabditis bacteriophora TaxID=37862 RepID=A0A1I7X0W1_HETBA